MEIRDNVFLITGGASGLGAATARLFAAEGGKIVVADLNHLSFERCSSPREARIWPDSARKGNVG